MQAQSSSRSANNRPAQTLGALYLHVPFCIRKCGYCDFYSLDGSSDLAGPLVEAVSAELSRRGSLLTVPLKSIFIGGGTPTALEVPLLQRLVETLGEYGDDQTEFSIEANPCTVTDDVSEVLFNAGVNRINIGAQSFVESELVALGRIHDPERITLAWDTLRASGHERLGLDLIYAAPGQSLESWELSLDKALSLKPDHLSCYALTVESDTDIGRQRDSGQFVEMDESLQAQCYRSAVDYARRAGLEQYEISNFALPGKRCEHNLTYWRNEPYLGLGPAAASYVNGVRRTNSPDIKAYVQAIQDGLEPPSTSEELTGRAEMGETIMLALRMVDGLDRKAFVRRFGMDPTEAFGSVIKRYCDQGALLLDDDRLRVAPEAMLVSNTILADILADA